MIKPTSREFKAAAKVMLWSIEEAHREIDKMTFWEKIREFPTADTKNRKRLANVFETHAEELEEIERKDRKQIARDLDCKYIAG